MSNVIINNVILLVSRGMCKLYFWITAIPHCITVHLTRKYVSLVIFIRKMVKLFTFKSTLNVSVFIFMSLCSRPKPYNIHTVSWSVHPIVANNLFTQGPEAFQEFVMQYWLANCTLIDELECICKHHDLAARYLNSLSGECCWMCNFVSFFQRNRLFVVYS